MLTIGQSIDCTQTTTTTIGVTMMGAEAIGSELNQVEVIRDFQAALKRRKLPGKTSVEALLDFEYRSGAQVPRLIPDFKERLRLVNQEKE